MAPPVVCVDIGSTQTKAVLVDPARLAGGRGAPVLAARPTTVPGDAADGLRAAVDALPVTPAPGDGVPSLLACSSAGGGLRIAVVGHERAVSAEAGRRAALTAGGRVVHVAAGRAGPGDVTELAASRPDLLLLVGGTDGGDGAVLRHNATVLAASPLVSGLPVVVAGNRDVAEEAAAALSGRGPVTVTRNVLPRIGELDVAPARAALRQAFLAHVIGGKHLTGDAALLAAVRAATPDAVLSGVEVLARAVGGGVLVVDVGGATTDVYSVLPPVDVGEDGPLPPTSVPDPEADVAGTAVALRTVEGDLGVRWGAPGVVAAAGAEGLLPDGGERQRLAEAAERRAAEPGWLPEDGQDAAVDRRLAGLAAVVALRRHARPDASGPVRVPGRDLRRVGLVVGSGGVLRHADAAGRDEVLGAVLDDAAGGWLRPADARTVVDESAVLAAVGLLAPGLPDLAAAVAGDLAAAGRRS